MALFVKSVGANKILFFPQRVHAEHVDEPNYDTAATLASNPSSRRNSCAFSQRTRDKNAAEHFLAHHDIHETRSATRVSRPATFTSRNGRERRSMFGKHCSCSTFCWTLVLFENFNGVFCSMLDGCFVGCSVRQSVVLDVLLDDVLFICSASKINVLFDVGKTVER